MPSWLEYQREPAEVRLPNGLSAHAETWDGIKSRADSLIARAWRLTLEDGQTLSIKALVKASGQAIPCASNQPQLGLDDSEETAQPLHLGFRLVVSNLNRSVPFYRDVLALPIRKRSAKSVIMGGVLSNAETNHSHAPGDHITVFIEVADIKKSLTAYRRHLRSQACRVEERADRIRAQCLDPDGYRLDIYQMRS